jgi:hypothetical protein
VEIAKQILKNFSPPISQIRSDKKVIGDMAVKTSGWSDKAKHP